MSLEIRKKEIYVDGTSRIKQVLEIVPISQSGLWKWIKEDRFPPPVKVGKVIFWRNRDLLRWLEENNL
ncbi:helix-turn-helix transcriptional regulator [Moraxella osloensis]|jgi:prophage regulatory protein|uniref:Helix-turn-helix domain-containing protein n=1 Tax=Faucicola osloensis TaxID=34062 RepID=A0A2D2LS44_FAUOS|nr:hypothetical protein NP7_00230 [Moraxella osloensis]